MHLGYFTITAPFISMRPPKCTSTIDWQQVNKAFYLVWPDLDSRVIMKGGTTVLGLIIKYKNLKISN